MELIVKTSPKELLRAKKWWHDLESQWKMAFNETVFGKGAVLETPEDDALMVLLIHTNTLRFAGPSATYPNMTTNLTNLSGLTPLFHLRFLSISNSNLTSLKELRKHTKLEHLFVYDNKLNSLEGVERMKDLKEIYFHNNEIENLAPLKKLRKLEVISASNNRITSLNGITEKHSKKLKKFYAMPNEGLKDRNIIKFQNANGIICHTA